MHIPSEVLAVVAIHSEVYCNGYAENRVHRLHRVRPLMVFHNQFISRELGKTVIGVVTIYIPAGESLYSIIFVHIRA